MVIKPRNKSFAFCGGAFGDEGKGRVVDKFVSLYALRGPVVVYRDNGGANAGHTIEFNNGTRLALHQLPSGVFVKNATVIAGKGMVLHPGDLLEEMEAIKKLSGGKIKAKILLDEMAVLSLDTHRIFEATLKNWALGGKGSTGRGIAPAYADILLRHPLRLRDLKPFNQEKVKKHYQLYKALLVGLGQDLARIKIPILGKKEPVAVGGFSQFAARLTGQAKKLSPFIADVSCFLQKNWLDQKTAFIFEKGQAVGLDYRWGVYPDVTASDTTLDGIFASTEGFVNPAAIKFRAAVLKATYMSSVGTRRLPTVMAEPLAQRIRDDANEYGASTGRPRGIAWLDIPALKFFSRVGRVNCLVLTHLDIVYPKQLIQVCLDYRIKDKSVSYRPDQEFLNKVEPRYIKFKPWPKEQLSRARRWQDLPQEAKRFINFLSQTMGLPVLMITTGPKREQGLIFRRIKLA